MRPRRWTAGLSVAVALTSGSLFGTGAVTASATRSDLSIQIHPDVRARFMSRAGPVSTAQCEQTWGIACYEPAQVQTAYDELPLFQNGDTGAGQTIAVIDAFGSPRIANDLATFDSSFNLPNPKLTIIQPAGKVPAFDPTNAEMAGWAIETTLDVEWAHVMAPDAAILLVETPVAETEGAQGFKQIAKAEAWVADHRLASVISESFSATEETFPSSTSIAPLRHGFLSAFQHGVTVLAASGDNGSTEPSNVSGSVPLLYTHPVTTWPPSDPLVTGVGGTELHLDSTGTRTSPDSVWNDGYNSTVDQLFFPDQAQPVAAASGGGRSIFFARPGYQAGVRDVVGGARGVPDVAMSASCNGAVDTYETVQNKDGSISGGWFLLCGTSEATPLFAGIVALADQQAGHSLGLLNPALYAMAAAGSPGLSPTTSGSNTVSFVQGGQSYTVPGSSANGGYNLATGLGTIDAARFVPGLVAAAAGHPVHGRGGGSGHGKDVAHVANGSRTGGSGHLANNGTGSGLIRTHSGLTTAAPKPAASAAGTAVASPASTAGPAVRSAVTTSSETSVATQSAVTTPPTPSGGSPSGSLAGPPSVVGQCVIEEALDLSDS